VEEREGMEGEGIGKRRGGKGKGGRGDSQSVPYFGSVLLATVVWT